MMATTRKILLIVLCAIMCGSCTQNRTEYDIGPYSYRPEVELCPLDAFDICLSVFTSHNGFGIVEQLLTLDLKIKDVNRDSHFTDNKVNQIEKKLEDVISDEGLFLFEYDLYKTCLAEVSGAIKMYADKDIGSYLAGMDIAELFVVSPQYGFLANAGYPDLEQLNIFGSKDNFRVKVPISEYFAVGTVPLMSLSDGCVLSIVEGYENLMQQIFDNSLNIYIEIPVTGINADGSEITSVLKTSLNN